MSNLFNQWDVVSFTSRFDQHDKWEGLVINENQKKILWDNGNITEGYGVSILLNSRKIDAVFDVEKAFNNAQIFGRYTLDNLTFIEVLVGYKKYLNEQRFR